jgi:hypothetical protein
MKNIISPLIGSAIGYCIGKYAQENPIKAFKNNPLPGIATIAFSTAVPMAATAILGLTGMPAVILRGGLAGLMSYCLTSASKSSSTDNAIHPADEAIAEYLSGNGKNKYDKNKYDKNKIAAVRFQEFLKTKPEIKVHFYRPQTIKIIECLSDDNYKDAAEEFMECVRECPAILSIVGSEKIEIIIKRLSLLGTKTREQTLEALEDNTYGKLKQIKGNDEDNTD